MSWARANFFEEICKNSQEFLAQDVLTVNGQDNLNLDNTNVSNSSTDSNGTLGSDDEYVASFHEEVDI